MVLGIVPTAMNIRTLFAVGAVTAASLASAQKLSGLTYTSSSLQTTGNQTATTGPLTVGSSKATATTFGTVDYGVHKLYSKHTGWYYNGNSTYQNASRSTSTTRIEDEITISSEGRNGEQGRLTFSYRIDGTLTATGGTMMNPGDFGSAGVASASSTLKLANGSFEHMWFEVADGSNTSDYFSGYERFLNKTYTQTVDFTFGTAMKLWWDASVETWAPNDQMSLNLEADLSHTGLWGGFSSVTDASGNSVAFRTSSLSGLNYAQPVPEPASIAALGFGALALLKRRKA